MLRRLRRILLRKAKAKIGASNWCATKYLFKRFVLPMLTLRPSSLIEDVNQITEVSFSLFFGGNPALRLETK